MVFSCRCFSLLFEEHEPIEYETRTQTKSTVNETFYTACSDLNRSVPNSHSKSPETLNLAEKQSNLRVFTVAELKTATKNFCMASKIGEGGFGCVYKGVIKSLEPPFDEIHVAVKLAKGLLQIILRDFKSSNILLDDQWNAKLSDFGVARLGPEEGFTHISTKFVGTMGYAAPEYLSVGRLTSKCDVWSYGVFLYELMTGRRPLDRNRPHKEQKLLEWMKPYLGSTKFQEIIDPRLEGNYPLKSAQKLSFIASCCLCKDPKSRPKMSEVLEMVNQLIAVPSEAVKHSKKDSRLSSCLSCFR